MSETSEEEYVPEPDPESDESLERDKRKKGTGGEYKGGKGEGRGRRRTQGEDSRSRSRAPSRGPGRRARQRTGALREEDRVCIAQLTADSITEMQVGRSYYVWIRIYCIYEMNTHFNQAIIKQFFDLLPDEAASTEPGGEGWDPPVSGDPPPRGDAGHSEIPAADTGTSSAR